jgi:hypothetical protein
MPWRLRPCTTTVSMFALTIRLIATLITSTPAQARTRTVFTRNKQTPTRSSCVQAPRTRAGTPLRARRIYRSRHPTTCAPFSVAFTSMLQDSTSPIASTLRISRFALALSLPTSTPVPAPTT